MRDHFSGSLHSRLPQLLRCRRLPIWVCSFYRPLTVVGIILTVSNLHHCHLNRALQFQYPGPILASTFRRRHYMHKNKPENGSSASIVVPIDSNFLPRRFDHKNKPENGSSASTVVPIDSNFLPRRFNHKNKPENGSYASVVVLIGSNILLLQIRGGMAEIFEVLFVVVALSASHSDTREQKQLLL
jgi:hypothetical protein